MNKLSEITIEYGLALLLNLSLNKNVLIHYLNKDNNVNVQTSINGALYSLLRKKGLKEEAKKFGIENIIQNSNIISYILKELESDNNNSEQDLDGNFDEDPNAIDEDNEVINDDDEYAKMDSIDDYSNYIFPF